MATVIEVQNLKKSFGNKQVLQGVDLKVDRRQE